MKSKTVVALVAAVCFILVLGRFTRLWSIHSEEARLERLAAEKQTTKQNNVKP